MRLILFRTVTILTLQNKDDSLLLYSLLVINQKTTTFITHYHHGEIWTNKLPEL